MEAQDLMVNQVNLVPKETEGLKALLDPPGRQDLLDCLVL